MISRQSGPLQNQLLEKVNEAHINKVLDFSEKEREREHSRSIHRKIFLGILLLIGGGSINIPNTGFKRR